MKLSIQLSAYRKSIISDISDASIGAGGCVFLPKTSFITLSSTDSIWKIIIKYDYTKTKSFQEMNSLAI